jgi:hypothetical protein
MNNKVQMNNNNSFNKISKTNKNKENKKLIMMRLQVSLNVYNN